MTNQIQSLTEVEITFARQNPAFKPMMAALGITAAADLFRRDSEFEQMALVAIIDRHASVNDAVNTLIRALAVKAADVAVAFDCAELAIRRAHGVDADKRRADHAAWLSTPEGRRSAALTAAQKAIAELNESNKDVRRAEARCAKIAARGGFGGPDKSKLTAVAVSKLAACRLALAAAKDVGVDFADIDGALPVDGFQKPLAEFVTLVAV